MIKLFRFPTLHYNTSCLIVPFNNGSNHRLTIKIIISQFKKKPIIFSIISNIKILTPTLMTNNAKAIKFK